MATTKLQDYTGLESESESDKDSKLNLGWGNEGLLSLDAGRLSFDALNHIMAGLAFKSDCPHTFTDKTTGKTTTKTTQQLLEPFVYVKWVQAVETYINLNEVSLKDSNSCRLILRSLFTTSKDILTNWKEASYFNFALNIGKQFFGNFRNLGGFCTKQTAVVTDSTFNEPLNESLKERSPQALEAEQKGI